MLLKKQVIYGCKVKQELTHISVSVGERYSDSIVITRSIG